MFYGVLNIKVFRIFMYYCSNLSLYTQTCVCSSEKEWWSNKFHDCPLSTEGVSQINFPLIIFPDNRLFVSQHSSGRFLKFQGPWLL